MPNQVINEDYAKKFREFGLAHPEMNELNNIRFRDATKLINQKRKKPKFIGVITIGDEVFDKVQALTDKNSIVIDANYQNIFEDYIKCDFDKDSQEYISDIVTGKSVEEIVAIIEEIFIKPLMSNDYVFDATTVYFKVPGPGADLSIYDSTITVE